MNDLPILRIRCGFNAFTAVLRTSDNNILGYTNGTIQSHYDKDEELKNMGLDVAQMVIGCAQEIGFSKIGIEMQGPMSMRIINSSYLQENGVEILWIKDLTPIPHNGCRPARRARLRK